MKLLGALAFLTVILIIPWGMFEPTINKVMNLVPLWLGVAAMLGVPAVFLETIIKGLREQRAAGTE